VLAAIPYTTFPTIALGPLELRTFGLMVGVGVLLGGYVAGRYAEARGGVPREETYKIATRMVLAGVVGARLTWVVTHLDEIDSAIDVIAVWEGGLQFSGGFLGAIIFGNPFLRRLPRIARWKSLDGYAWGLAAGIGIGRIGCYSVGEHFGSETSFFLANRYDGGSVRESTLGGVPLVPGTVFHNTSLYEFIYMAVLFGVLALLARRRVRTGTMIAVFCAYYSVARFSTDLLRVNDETVLGLTGAQYLCILLAVASVWIWFHKRPQLARLEAAAATEAEASTEASGDRGDPAPAVADDESAGRSET
jgi:phosphatidylglycerol:prolipoprotein diacylglycerol transferase